MDTALLGQPVELGQIGRELKKLWESTGGTQTRASLVNFAVICEGAEALERNTQLIFNLTRDHSCRALLIARDLAPNPAGPAVEAWMNAHCHLPRAGAKHVCCEQITVLLHSGSQQLLLNTLFANLDSDLPLYLWWQGELPHPVDEQLWSWVDRLIFDSREWRAPGEQFCALQTALREAGARLILCDLNWTRTLHLRQAVAQMFDHPENAAEIPRLSKLVLAHAPGHASTAILFAGWIAAQLGWTDARREGEGLTFRTPAGGEVRGELHEAEGSPVGSCELAGDGVSVKIQRQPGAPFYQAEVRSPEGKTYQHLLPAGSDDLGEVLSEEISLGGRHRVYLKALEVAEGML